MSSQDYTILAYEGKTPILGKDVFIAAGVRLIGDLVLGDRANIWFNSVIRADVHYIRIGEDTNIQDNSIIHVTTDKYPTIIGNQVTVGHSATLHACIISDLCLIGMGATLLDGCVIGCKSMVAAGSLVPPGREYPEESLILGNPATVKRKLTRGEIDFLSLSAERYVKLAAKYSQT